VKGRLQLRHHRATGHVADTLSSARPSPVTTTAAGPTPHTPDVQVGTAHAAGRFCG
jgi:hypothetical protein